MKIDKNDVSFGGYEIDNEEMEETSDEEEDEDSESIHYEEEDL